MSEGSATAEHQQRRTLLIVLVLNFLLFVALGVSGWIADSSALIANAVDNLSDTVVYAISWIAVGKSARMKRGVSRASGIMLLIFAALVLVDAVRRPFFGPEPVGMTMITMAAIAAVVNLVCLFLLKPLKTDDVNLRAAQTFSANDFFSNGGIVVAGALVWWTGSWIPDVLVGLVVALVALLGAREIMVEAKKDGVKSHGST